MIVIFQICERNFFLHGILVLRANDQNRPSIIEGADIF